MTRTELDAIRARNVRTTRHSWMQADADRRAFNDFAPNDPRPWVPKPQASAHKRGHRLRTRDRPGILLQRPQPSRYLVCVAGEVVEVRSKIASSRAVNEPGGGAGSISAGGGAGARHVIWTGVGTQPDDPTHSRPSAQRRQFGLVRFHGNDCRMACCLL